MVRLRSPVRPEQFLRANNLREPVRQHGHRSGMRILRTDLPLRIPIVFHRERCTSIRCHSDLEPTIRRRARVVVDALRSIHADDHDPILPAAQLLQPAHQFESGVGEGAADVLVQQGLVVEGGAARGCFEGFRVEGFVDGIGLVGVVVVDVDQWEVVGAPVVEDFLDVGG